MKLKLHITEHPRMAQVRIRVDGRWRSLTDWFGSTVAGAKELARLRQLNTIDGVEARTLLREIRETFPRLVCVRNPVIPAEWTFQLSSAHGGWFFHQGTAASPLIKDGDDAMEFLARAVHEGTCPEELVEFLVDQAERALATQSSALEDAPTLQ